MLGRYISSTCQRAHEFYFIFKKELRTSTTLYVGLLIPWFWFPSFEARGVTGLLWPTFSAKLDIFTARILSMMGGYVFTGVCLFTGGYLWPLVPSYLRYFPGGTPDHCQSPWGDTRDCHWSCPRSCWGRRVPLF